LGLAARIATCLFGAPEEINGARRCPTYLYRWIVLSTRWFKIYLHRFVGDDWSLDLHDHPKRFITIGLLGSYLETTPSGQRWYHAPWVRSFPATHRHRLQTPLGDCWTLCIVLKHEREWGFWNKGHWIRWDKYTTGSAKDIADRRKSCV
jgi:hypothetical protein